MSLTRKIVVFFIVLGLIGCASKESQLIGMWKADTTSTGNSAADSLAKSMAGSVSIEFRKDHTFTMTMFVSAEGTWAFEGDKVTLTINKVMGIAQSGNTQTEQLTLSGDGKTLTPVQKSGQTSGPPIKFVKS